MSSRDRVRIWRDPLSPESALVAEKELREIPERAAEALAALRELLAGRKDLVYPDTDEFLIRFLRPTKYYPESALGLMVRAAEFKNKNASVVQGLKPEDEQSTLTDNDVVNVVVDRDQDGRRILIMNLGKKWDPSKVTTNQIFRCLYLTHIGACLEPETQVKGAVVIMDFSGLGMRQVTSFTPSFSKLLLSFIQEAMPLRLKQVHIVNEPYIFNMVFQIFKPLIKDKLKARMFFHGNKMASLHKHMDPAFLPADFGGSKPAIDYSSKDWYPVLVSLEDEVKEWNSFQLASS
ncbi:clavesin-1 [Bacillus rossius redtenbacheri]|uniref:clavesin-1 n=1 Tax=Bacillus rossius redtenbacheri TaxID=93214 RepID=UPI002FDCB759